MAMRKEDHQAMQVMYEFRTKSTAESKGKWDQLSLVREIPAAEMDVPIRNKR
jgi:branched-chain amino acid transport system substrate-binding protein